MKNIQNIFRILVLTIACLLPVGCEKGLDGIEKTPTQLMSELLRAQTWELSELTIDDLPSNLYPGMTLRFGEGTYVSTGGEPIWPASGTWQFRGDDPNQLLRDDGLIITVEAASIVGAKITPLDPYWEQVAANVILSFDWASTTYKGSGGRSQALKGTHLIKFKKKV
jgi:hypothetical protein